MSVLDLPVLVGPWEAAADPEEALYRELVARTGGGVTGVVVVELAADPSEGDPELTDAQLEALVADLVADDEQEQLYRQLEALGRG